MTPDLARRQALLAMMAAMLAGCTSRESAPGFGYTLLDGSRHDSAALRGHVVWVNFWATTCSTCVAEMPNVIALHQRFRASAFDTLAVAMAYDPPASVARYAETRQLPFGVVIDNTGAIAHAFGDVQATPTSFLLDKRGGIAKRFTGAPDFAALPGLIETLLAEA
jgi:peroxiredoxin